MPPRAVAVEPVEDGLYSLVEAAVFARAFNEIMLSDTRPLWVVAVPVSLRFDGDATSGMPIVGRAIDLGEVETSSGVGEA